MGVETRKPAYRRNDLVKCDGCHLVFIARAAPTVCRRCGGERLHGLRANPNRGGARSELYGARRR